MPILWHIIYILSIDKVDNKGEYKHIVSLE